VTPLRSLLIGGAALALLAAASTSSAEAQSGYPTHLAAPYLQIATSDSGDIAADMNATGLEYYTLAFLTSAGGCAMNWEDGNESVGAFKSVVHSLQAAGGNVIISFGGAGSTEVAETCHSVTKLEQTYASVLADYPGVTRLDFDIESTSISNNAATARRNKALALLETDDPSVSIDYTLPVNANGLPATPQLAIIKQAKADGVRLNVVNIMTMYFGKGDDLDPTESAAIATEKQLAEVYPNLSTSQLWEMIGMTTVASASYNDGERFTLSDASSLESWAANQGVGELAFWQVAHDGSSTGYKYSSIFNQFNS
jgi:chitinase